MNRRLQTIRTLGLAQSAWFAFYRFGLHSGHYRRSSPSRREEALWQIIPLWPLPVPTALPALLDKNARTALRKEVEEILQGRARLFGAPPVPIQLQPPEPPVHWTEYELGRAAWGVEDVKDIWEPARFGWVFPLRAPFPSHRRSALPGGFLAPIRDLRPCQPAQPRPQLDFRPGNRPAHGRVSLRRRRVRLLPRKLSRAPHPPGPILRGTRRRIPLTLPYARAQHNNHQVSEGLGLYLAGLSLPAHPSAIHWRELGWRELNRALQSQIAPSGAYCQHSTNYHRLMLQAALLADCFARREGLAWPEQTLWKLWDASRWLYQQMDQISGSVPNLGHNDGAHILPLASGGFADYRPTVQAAARAFAQGPILPRGPWDELGLWLHLSAPNKMAAFDLLETKGFIQQRLFNPDGPGWASLRAVHHTSRPAHADQLHTEIWHNGQNIALDAGTYRYSAAPPWENALASTLVHNTVSLDGLDQMTRAGKFLWLDWAQARFVKGDPGLGRLAAVQDGYRSHGIVHRRTLCRDSASGWMVEDEMLPSGSRHARHIFTLHWLLPDWPYQLEEHNTLCLNSPGGGYPDTG